MSKVFQRVALQTPGGPHGIIPISALLPSGHPQHPKAALACGLAPLVEEGTPVSPSLAAVLLWGPWEVPQGTSVCCSPLASRAAVGQCLATNKELLGTAKLPPPSLSAGPPYCKVHGTGPLSCPCPGGDKGS